jgi:hypothetical protein
MVVEEPAHLHVDQQVMDVLRKDKAAIVSV